jgi:hypothetical protein
MGLLDLFRTKNLSSVINKTYHVKVHGVKFELRKINPIDYMSGSKAVISNFDTYKVGTEKNAEPTVNVTKIKEHYIDVFMASVVSPKFFREGKDVPGGICVSLLFSDWDLAGDLYSKIIEISYGKKKLKSLLSQKTSSSS